MSDNEDDKKNINEGVPPSEDDNQPKVDNNNQPGGVEDQNNDHAAEDNALREGETAVLSILA